MKARIVDDGKLRTTSDLAAIEAALAAGTPMWIDLEQHDAAADAVLAKLPLHALTVEDIWSSRVVPKIEDYDEYLYVLVHGISSATDRLHLVELDVVIGPHWLLTHDDTGTISGDVAADLERSSRPLARGPAWLAHAFLDRAVDRYLPVVDQLDTRIEALENDVLEQAGTPRGKQVLLRILSFKRMLQELRRTSIHQREILLRLSRGEFDEIPAESLPFFRDVYDHFLRINDIAEGYRDLVTSSLDAYLSVQSNRMNEIMKTLTLISTTMLPLTFIVGLYGMNFHTMPELSWRYGYPYAIALMVVVAAGILYGFRRKGWLGGGGGPD